MPMPAACIDELRIEEPASLEDFKLERFDVGVAVSHAFEDLDFVVEPFGDRCGEIGFDVGLDVQSVFSHLHGELSKASDF